MGSPWLSVADTSSPFHYQNYHPLGSGHFHGNPRLTRHDYTYVSINQDPGFFDGEDRNGVSSNTSETVQIQQSPALSHWNTAFSGAVLPSRFPHHLYQPGSAIDYGSSSSNHSSTANGTGSHSKGPKRGFHKSLQIKEEYDKKRCKHKLISHIVQVHEIPSWEIYFNDQRHQLVKFTDNTRTIIRDSKLNKRVSISFHNEVIARLNVDAVVCPTTESYAADNGVAKLLHTSAGSGLQEACEKLQRCGSGNVQITEGCELPAKYVLMVNGPHLGSSSLSECEDLLGQCYENCLDALLKNQLRTIAIPCISTGRKGVPKRPAAEVALKTVRRFLESNWEQVDRIIFCLHNKKDVDIYLRLMQIYFPLEY